MAAPARHWDVLLLGGASGVGKTSISYALAQRFGVALTEVDDFQILLERMTSPEHQPALHAWRIHPDPDALSVDEIVRMNIAFGEAMAPGLSAVIANHLETNTPLVLEGDFLLPRLAAQTHFLAERNDGRVRGLFLHEGDAAQIERNYDARETKGPQTKRAMVSAAYGAWLKAEAEQHNVAVIAARPWDNVLERALVAVS